MLLPKIQLTFFQNDNNRKKLIRINYCNHFEYSESTEELIPVGTLLLPYNSLYVNIIDSVNELEMYDENDIFRFQKTIELEELPLTNIAAKDFDGNLLYNLISDYDKDDINRNKQPLFKIGDLLNVKITYIDQITNNLVEGKIYYDQDFVITRLALSDKLEISFAAHSWYLKQIPVTDKQINAGTNLNDMIVDFIEKIDEKTPYFSAMGFAGSESVSFNSQLIINGNMTAAQFLDKIRTDYMISSYMAYGNLFFGKLASSVVSAKGPDGYPLIILGANEIPRFYSFQMNIIDDSNLVFKNKDGINLSAIVSNTYETTTGQMTKDGQAKTKKTKMSVYIEYTKKNNDILNEYKQKNKFTQKIPIKLLDNVIILYDNDGKKVGEAPSAEKNNVDAERRTFVDPSAKNTNDLIMFGLTQLQKFYYDGLKGDFETFGEPTTFVTDIIQIEDLYHPEKNGNYRVKGVKTSFGMDGYRQNITLDFKIPDSEINK